MLNFQRGGAVKGGRDANADVLGKGSHHQLLSKRTHGDMIAAQHPDMLAPGSQSRKFQSGGGMYSGGAGGADRYNNRQQGSN